MKKPYRLFMEARKGNKAALEMFLQEIRLKLFNYIKIRVRSLEEAEDILQEVLVAVWKGADYYRDEASPYTWIYSIARNKIADYYRKNQGQKIELEQEKKQARTGEKDEIEGRVDLLQALLTLDEKTREAFFLVYYSGLRYEEVAEVLSLPIGTVKSSIFYGKKKLRSILKGGWDR